MSVRRRVIIRIEGKAMFGQRAVSMPHQIEVSVVREVHNRIFICSSPIANLYLILLRQGIADREIEISRKSLVHIFGEEDKSHRILAVVFQLKKSSSVIIRTGMAIARLPVIQKKTVLFSVNLKRSSRNAIAVPSYNFSHVPRVFHDILPVSDRKKKI